MIKVAEFQGEHRFLSNFWPCYVHLDDLIFHSVEHAYQASKTLDKDMRERISLMVNPGAVKQLGRTIKLRPNWDQIKVQVMRHLVTEKFTNPQLAEWLLKTGDVMLEEGNRWGDTFWGIDLRTGQGQNHLGQILMDVRSTIRIQRGATHASTKA